MAQLKAGTTVGGVAAVVSTDLNSYATTASLSSYATTASLSSYLLKAGGELTGPLTLMEVLETANIVGTAYSGTVSIQINTGVVFYNTASATGNITLNFIGDGSNSLNSVLGVSKSLTVAILMTNGATPYRPTVFQIDGSAITPKWAGGTAPSAGNASAVDIYSFTIIKTAATPTYVMFASQTKYA